MLMYSFIRSMYLCRASGGRVLDSLMIFGWVVVPIFTSSTSSQSGISFGSFATSFWSKRCYNGTRPLGNALLFSCRIFLPHRLFRHSCCSSDSCETNRLVSSSPSMENPVGTSSSTWDSSKMVVCHISTSSECGIASRGESLSLMTKYLKFPSR